MLVAVVAVAMAELAILSTAPCPKLPTPRYSTAVVPEGATAATKVKTTMMFSMISEAVVIIVVVVEVTTCCTTEQ